MSTRFDAFGRPTGLESPDELGGAFTIDSAFVNDRQRLQADRPASLDDTMLMIDVLLKKYETTYKSHKLNSKLIWMPYLFIEPSSGDIIKNKTTGEQYTVNEVVIKALDLFEPMLLKVTAIEEHTCDGTSFILVYPDAFFIQYLLVALKADLLSVQFPIL